MAKNASYCGRGAICMLEDIETQNEDISSLIRTERGSNRAASRTSEYRPRRSAEDGYDELDFA
jgi:hypothetical protein